MPVGRPGAKRVYSNPGIELVAEIVAARAEMPFERYLSEAVLEPLGLRCRAARLPRRRSLRLAGRPHALRRASCSRRGSSRRRRWPRRRRVQFPGLAGVLPDLGRFDPNDWGLGFELKDGKQPHWSGSRTSPRTFGHFGGSGTFLWVDPDVGSRPLLPHRPRVRPVGDGSLAEAVRRRARDALGRSPRDSH